MDNTNAGLQQILTDLADVHTALRDSSTAFDTAMDAISARQDVTAAVTTGIAALAANMQDAINHDRAVLAAVAAANHAQGAAIDALGVAIHDALRLFHADPQ